jgi:hypothetical protein
VQAFIVLDGSMDVFRVTNGESESVTVQAGEMVLVPSNAMHGFCNRSGRDARILILCTGGLEAFFEEASIPVEACPSTEIEPPKPEEIHRVLAIARKHGQVFVDNGEAAHAAF